MVDLWVVGKECAEGNTQQQQDIIRNSGRQYVQLLSEIEYKSARNKYTFLPLGSYWRCRAKVSEDIN